MASLGSCDVLEEYAPSGIEFPGPATSSISRNYTAEGYNFGVVVESTLVHGAHDGYAYAAGFTALAQNAATAQANGQLFDTLIMTGGAGAARLHLPIRLTGDVEVTRSAPALYPDPGAEVSYRIVCAAAEPGSPVPADCPDPEIHWDASTSVDEVVEVVFAFNFGAQMVIDLRPSLSASVLASGALAVGSLTGTAEATLSADFEPAYVTTLGGAPIPGVAIASESGFDYVNAPEPDAGLLAAVAAACLAVLRPRCRSAARVASAATPSWSSEGSGTRIERERSSA